MTDTDDLEKPIPEAPGIWRLPLPMRGAPGHINSWLLEDGDGWLVVDCGVRSGRTREVWQAFMASPLYRGGIRRIFLTHAHPDHAGSAAWLARETGAPVLVASEELQALNNFSVADEIRDAEITQWLQRYGASEQQIEYCRLFYAHFAQGSPAIDSPVEIIAPGDELTIGGRRWQLHGGYGHTPCNLLLHQPDDGLLITGDQILPDIVTHVGLWWRQSETPLGSYLESLERLEALPVARALPAHGDVFDGFGERCRRLGEIHDQRLRRIEDALAEEPLTLQAILRRFGGKAVDTPMFPLVAGQIYARLARLEEQGRVETFEDGRGLRYRPGAAGA